MTSPDDAREGIRMRDVYVVGTFDTKGDELRYVRDVLLNAGATVTTVDLGTTGVACDVTVSATELASYHPQGADAVFTRDRGSAVAAMTQAFSTFCEQRRGQIGGMLGLGGSGGTALISAGMRTLPIGIPKILVSTVASGNVAPYVGLSDIAMLYSVTDVAGLNNISRQIFANAARAIAGMVTQDVATATRSDRPAVGLTMFGVTTPCVTSVSELLRDRYDCLVFHATGTGGRAMEKLVDDGLISGVFDISTTEVCDLIAGGVFAAGEDRLDAVARTRVPYVGSCGALDMVNFGPPETVPERYRSRLFYQHNPAVTLMRTTVDECARIGSWLARKLNACEGPVRFLIPEKGVSAIDAPGQPFHDPDADAVLFQALEDGVRRTERRRLERLPYHVNDKSFAEALVSAFDETVREG